MLHMICQSKVHQAYGINKTVRQVGVELMTL